MRKKFLTIAILIYTTTLHAQNYGFGTSNPLATVHIAGNFFINQSFKKPIAAPTSTQTKNMLAGGQIGFAETDSTGRFYDPSGPRSPLFYRPYAPNTTAYAFIPPASQYGTTSLEITIEWGGLGDGDSIFITGDPDVTYRIGAGWVAPRTFLVRAAGSYITFVSNSDLSVGEGFSIVFRRLYDQPITTPQNIFGNQLYFDPNKGSIQTGYVNTGFFYEGLRTNAAAFGYLTNTGDYSLAGGFKNDAGGVSSFSVGAFNKAIGNTSVAMGSRNTASGYYSTALGGENTASGTISLATGYATTASGNYSTTMGFGTQSSSLLCVSLGRHNFTAPTSATSWIPSEPVLLVGNGLSPTLRQNIFEFYKNGNMLVWGTVSQFSDEKLKKDIKPITNSLQRLGALNGYNYTWISKEVDDRLQTGMMAQEVEKVFPELISKNQKGESAVNYIGLIPHLVEAIKELKQEIATLKAEKLKP